MKKILAGVLILCAGFTYGQDRERTKKSPEEKAELMTERISKKLNLTEDQQKTVYDLNLQEAKRRDAQRAEMSDDREARKEAMMANKERYEKDLMAVLDEEQKTEFLRLKEEREAKRAKKKKERKECKEKCKEDKQ